ncbi:MAG: hypothetical protein A2Z04_01840 [Chloroflexi bacterium RBG_16_57_9]|nr:MAG: hypothetical protein A2Z04_01840 [Chloroflexi bacterium RBG_16_57_9]
MTRTLYEQDFYAWANRNAQLIRAGKLSEIDVENIAEELESMGRSEKRAFINRLAILLAHLLKWHFQPALRSISWQYTIRAQRDQLYDLLEDSPSLKYQVEEKLNKAYRKAVSMASHETGLEESAFPENCPYAFDQVMDNSFFPE